MATQLALCDLLNELRLTVTPSSASTGVGRLVSTAWSVVSDCSPESSFTSSRDWLVDRQEIERGPSTVGLENLVLSWEQESAE